jgi:predicted lysophospholipase L1 biosynthesis ABC-type transport system permease subunit
MTLAVRYFWLGLRRGQFRWLWLAILLASLSVTFIEQLAQTVKASMLANSAQLLGADAVAALAIGPASAPPRSSVGARTRLTWMGRPSGSLSPG